jgi:hypothetical protein
MNKLASQLLEKAKDFIEENPGLVTGLAASGGLGALGGAVFTDTDETDSAGEKFKKRLKNALIAGGLASAAFGAGSYGLSKLKNALPEDDESPLSAAVHSTPVRALGGGVGLAAGLGMQHKKQLDALAQVFPDSPMTKARLIEILNNPGADTGAMNAISKAWGGTDTPSFRKWLENTGIDVTKLTDKSLSGIDKTTDAIGDFLSKNKLVGNAADTLKLTPEKLAKLFHKVKANKYLLGATGLGLALPEIASATGNAVSSLFGGSLYE